MGYRGLNEVSKPNSGRPALGECMCIEKLVLTRSANDHIKLKMFPIDELDSGFSDSLDMCWYEFDLDSR